MPAAPRSPPWRGKFRDEPRTDELLRARAVDDPDADARGAALVALGQHFRDDPRTVELLRARAVDDPLGYVRGAALLALAPSLGVEDAAVLCSQDLDGFDPGLDPREPVTAAMVAKAAARLHLPEATSPRSLRTAGARRAADAGVADATARAGTLTGRSRPQLLRR